MAQFEQQTAPDEIDLLDLIRSVAKTWKIWFFCLIVVTIAFGLLQASKILLATPSQTYSKPIRLTFPGAAKLHFPSGAAFSYGDIIAPAIVREAFERNHLSELGFNVADIQNALSATPFAPTYPLIIAKYKKLSDDKKLNADQLKDLQKQMDDEIAQATSGEALITLSTDKQNLPSGLANQFLNDLVSIWANKAIKEKGVLDINARIASGSSLNKELILQEDPLIAADIVANKLNLLHSNIQSLSAFEGVDSIRDPQTGMNLSDLSYVIDDLERYVIASLIAPIKQLGISENQESLMYYFQNKLSHLNFELAGLNQQASALADINNMFSTTTQNDTTTRAENNSSPALITQLNSDVLDKIVGLSGAQEKEKYRQELTDKWLALTNKIAAKQLEQSETNYILSGLQKGLASKGSSQQNQAYLNKFKNALPEVLSKISNYFDISERIYQQISAETVGVKDQLYIPLTNSVLVDKQYIDLKGTLVLWIALMFLTSVLVVPFCMIRNAIKSRAS